MHGAGKVKVSPSLVNIFLTAIKKKVFFRVDSFRFPIVILMFLNPF